jgi:ribose transport system permease protein
MELLAVDPYWVTFLLGSLILAAVWINRIRTVRMEGAR